MKEKFAFASLAFADLGWLVSARGFESFLARLGWASPEKLERLSRIRSRRAYYRTLRHVPAYRDFIAKSATDPEQVPETDKASYTASYSIEERCCGGKIPHRRTMIDESSGSTGVPYNWVRSPKERAVSHKSVDFFARYCYGDEETIVINAFSMGAWATGLNMGQALLQLAIVKNIGPDIDKILSTLRLFGTRFRYLVLGYPPFLKHLIDQADRESVSLDEYRLDALVGGEGMSEGLREYLQRSFRTVYSGYGATDLELGLAGETPVSVALRRLARDDISVRQLLFGEDPRLPMVFQYNPLLHYVETNDQSELIFTILRGNVLSPRIRYNIHDEGGIARFDEVQHLLAKRGIVLADLAHGIRPVVRLPFLWVYGRRDSTISIMGANIYPEDLEECVYADPLIARQVSSFCMELAESDAAQVQACFHFEVGSPNDDLRAQIAESVYEKLLQLNADFRAAAKEYPDALKPQVHLHRTNEGPFAANSSRIKHVRRVGLQQR